jgi:E3 ubiquitin-protein ligase RNF115/126
MPFRLHRNSKCNPKSPSDTVDGMSRKAPWHSAVSLTRTDADHASGQIEEDHDPREEYMDDLHHLPNEAAFDPANAPDPEEEDINRLHFTPTPNGYSMHGVFTNSPSQRDATPDAGPQQPQSGEPGAPVDPSRNAVATSFANMLSGFLGLGQGQGAPSTITRFPGGQTTTRTYNFGGGRVTYTSATFGTRMPPSRDPNNPHPNMPVEDLQTYVSTVPVSIMSLLTAFSILNQLMTNLDGPPQPRGGPFGPGMGAPINPLASLFGMLLNPAAAQHGDAVYTQEALDRVISQLMEQNQMGSAPGPANPQDIASLPKKQVDKSMLGDNGKAECSICMDEVHIGDEVTQLYCSHWFHGPCVAAWLNEHDTCPHCRKGIVQARDEAQGRSSSSRSAPSTSRDPAQRRRSSISLHRTSSRTDNDLHRRRSHPDSGGSSHGGGSLFDRARSFFSRGSNS